MITRILNNPGQSADYSTINGPMHATSLKLDTDLKLLNTDVTWTNKFDPEVCIAYLKARE